MKASGRSSAESSRLGIDPEVVVGGGFVGGVGFGRPVDRGEDDERVRRAEIDPEQAVRGAEVRDATVDGEVAILLRGDCTVAREKERDDGVERLVFAGFGPHMACGRWKLLESSAWKRASRRRSAARPMGSGFAKAQSHCRLSVG